MCVDWSNISAILWNIPLHLIPISIIWYDMCCSQIVFTINNQPCICCIFQSQGQIMNNDYLITSGSYANKHWNSILFWACPINFLLVALAPKKMPLSAFMISLRSNVADEKILEALVYLHTELVMFVNFK